MTTIKKPCLNQRQWRPSTLAKPRDLKTPKKATHPKKTYYRRANRPKKKNKKQKTRLGVMRTRYKGLDYNLLISLQWNGLYIYYCPWTFFVSLILILKRILLGLNGIIFMLYAWPSYYYHRLVPFYFDAKWLT